MRGLYAIADLDSLSGRRLDPLAFVRGVVEGGAALLQVRGKRASARAVLDLLRSSAPICAAAGVPLVVNDRADLALMSGARWLHVGQTDPTPADVARLTTRDGAAVLSVGVSTHDELQAESALELRPAYVAVGPVAGTRTKEDPDPVLGVARARAIAQRLKAARGDLPVVAIGGIDADLASQLAGAFDLVAVVGALLPDPGEDALAGSRSRARRLVAAFQEGGR